jgi:type IV secretory pathway VirB6-like protein
MWWQQYLTNSSGVQLTGSSPAGMLDWVYNTTYSTEAAIWLATPWSFHAVEVAIALVVARTIIVLSLAAMFTSYAMLTLLAMVLLILGPVFIPFALFSATVFVFRSWVWATATLVLSMLAIDILLSLFMAVMTALMQALVVSGTPQTDIPSFWGAAIVMGILGWSVHYVPRLIERIGSGVSVGLESAAYQMSGGPFRAAAMRVASAPSNFVRRNFGI